MSLVPRKSLVLLELKNKRKTQRRYRQRSKQTEQHSGIDVPNGHKNFRKLNEIDVAFYIGVRKTDYSIHGQLINHSLKVKS